MSRYRYEIDAVRSHVRSLWIVIVAFALLAVVLTVGLMRAPENITVHIPPDIRSGAQMKLGEIGPANVYAFGFYIFQQLNNWPENGAEDYGAAIYSLSPYLTPRYRADLIADLETKGRQGELVNRVRGVREIFGAGYEEQRVDLVSKGVWVVWLDLEILETVHGMTVKEAGIRYPIRVVRRNVNPESNPWGLALDGFSAGGPVRIPIDDELTDEDPHDNES